MQDILVTGGTGFIGSHTVVALQQAGYRVVILDDLSNSTSSVVERIEHITGTAPVLVQGSIEDKILLQKIFATYTFDAVLHFAGLKSVSESCQQPFRYRHTNIIGTMHLLEVMDIYKVHHLVFSSSATVYDTFSGDAPFSENMRTGNTTNPYGTTKYVIEQLLQDMVQWKDMSIVSLRYFNPIGAHPSGLLGEDPLDTPNNLLPVIMRVVEGKQTELIVYGDDYPTSDGTCIRDYIHVVDVADAHLHALQALLQGTHHEYMIYNIGTGCGMSVLEMVQLCSEVINSDIPTVIGSRRDGDPATVVADVSKIEQELGWKASLKIADGIKDNRNFRQNIYS